MHMLGKHGWAATFGALELSLVSSATFLPKDSQGMHTYKGRGSFKLRGFLSEVWNSQMTNVLWESWFNGVSPISSLFMARSLPVDNTHTEHNVGD